MAAWRWWNKQKKHLRERNTAWYFGLLQGRRALLGGVGDLSLAGVGGLSLGWVESFHYGEVGYLPFG